MEKARNKNKRKRIGKYSVEELIAFSNDTKIEDNKRWAIIQALKILINEL
jgi:hypothetical protein